ncbi:MAG: TIGR03084 family protein [Kutzneria sp.]|nr:TIGR03084 family protein [Kutzneria sp.]MBV9844823.1 TIGR03084 family protein [Kutzneria sp.]
MTVLNSLLADLAAESAELDAMVGDLPATDWARPTPASGWTIAHQIAHLAWTDRQAVRAATDAAGFAAEAGAALANPAGFVDAAADQGARQPPAELLAAWRAGRDRLAAALRAVPAGQKLPWFGPAMGTASMATARLMETWAHGLDVADALGASRAPTARLRHVAHIGVRTLGFSFQANGLEVALEPVRVELAAPDGTRWSWGPQDAANRVRGPALDFCQLVTQRRHRDDLALLAVGDLACRWLEVAQAFAGPPGAGRAPGGPT